MARKLAIELLREADGEAAAVERAVQMHMDCPDCQGEGGASCFYPECPCPGCGFNYADSFGVETIVEILEQRKGAKA